MHFYGILILVTLIISLIVKKLVYTMLIGSNATGRNYLNEDIPVGMGVMFPIALICSLAILYIFFSLDLILFIFLLGFITMAFVGFIDDILGNKDIQGLKGHIGKLLKVELTTGGLKALMGGIIALFISMPFQNNILILLLDGLIIALFTNLINLLDLRPGRAIKAYLLYSIILFIFFYSHQYIYLLLIVTVIVLIYFPMDIKAQAMMGDVGSNTLGFTLGFFSTI